MDRFLETVSKHFEVREIEIHTDREMDGCHVSYDHIHCTRSDSPVQVVASTPQRLAETLRLDTALDTSTLQRNPHRVNALFFLHFGMTIA